MMRSLHPDAELLLIIGKPINEETILTAIDMGIKRLGCTLQGTSKQMVDLAHKAGISVSLWPNATPEDIMSLKTTFAIDSVINSEDFNHSKFVAYRTKDAIADYFMFGDASKTVLIEEFMDGIECSVFVMSDGKDYKVLPVAKDYKRIGEGNTGLNTGGMGAVSPVPFANDTFMIFFGCRDQSAQTFLAVLPAL